MSTQEQIAQIIQYEGDNQTFLWKHPTEDFYAGSQLIVHESQEAVFFMNGQALDTFGPGRHTLETQNMPLVSRLFSAPTGGRTPFHCEIYFINKTEQMAIKWGTDTKMEYVEPVYGFPIQLGACGEMCLQVEDGRKLLTKVVGTERGIGQSQLIQKFRAFLMTRVKPYLVTLIRKDQLNIFQIDERLQEISAALREMLTGDFREYGMSLTQFLVTTIVKPEEDKNYQRFKQLHFRQYADVAEAKLRQQIGVIEQQTAAQRMVIEAEGIARKRQVEGYTYQDERGFDVAERVASNQAVGQLTNMGIGLGMVSGIGAPLSGAVGGMMSQAVGKTLGGGTPVGGTPAVGVAVPVGSGALAASPEKCAACGASLPTGAKFCSACGAKAAVAVPASEEALCVACGAKIPKARFCPECGAPQEAKCPKCGKVASPGTKFCPECGTSLVKEK